MKATQRTAEIWIEDRAKPFILPRTQFELAAFLLAFAQYVQNPSKEAKEYAQSRVGERGDWNMGRGVSNQYEFDALAEAFEAGLSSQSRS